MSTGPENGDELGLTQPESHHHVLRDEATRLQGSLARAMAELEQIRAMMTPPGTRPPLPRQAFGSCGGFGTRS